MGLYDYNNNINNTKSNKIRKISLLLQYVTKKISESQEISRMLCYNTKNPLSTSGLGYDGEVVEQPKVETSSVMKYIYDIGFNPDILLDSNSQLFINITRGRFRANQNKLIMEINIIVPETFSKISNGYRHFEIAQSVADIFDNVYIDPSDLIDYKNLGALKFELTDVNNGRLSKNDNYVWLNMVFEIELLGAKYRANIGG